jgi:uncharacterized membrane protein YjfL (UPF0719 family)
MDFSIIAVNILYAVIGLALLFGAYWIFDSQLLQINLRQELKNGNIAVAIFFAALFICFAIIISSCLS